MIDPDFNEIKEHFTKTERWARRLILIMVTAGLTILALLIWAVIRLILHFT